MSESRQAGPEPNILLPGDIILTSGRGFLDGLNRLLQAVARRTLSISPFSHAAICASPSSVYDADIRKPAGTRDLEAWLKDVSYGDALVFRRPISLPEKAITSAADAEKQKTQNDPELREVSGNGRNLEIVTLARYFAGRRYNWLFLRGKSANTSRRSFFCSELVASVLARIQPEAVKRPPEKILPIDLPDLLVNAGWHKYKLADLHVLDRWNAQDQMAETEISDKVKEALKDHPEVLELLQRMRAEPGPLKELDALMKEMPVSEQRIEQVQVTSAGQMKNMMDAAVRYQDTVVTELGNAEGLDAKRQVLIDADMPPDIREIPAAMGWFTIVLRKAPPQRGVHEDVDDAMKRSHDIVVRRLFTESARATMLVFDIETMIERCKAIAIEGAKIEQRDAHFAFAKRELTSIIETYPYVERLDGILKADFEQKLAACRETFERPDVKETLGPALHATASDLIGIWEKIGMLFLFADYFPQAE